MIEINEIRRLLDYDPLTGVFTWRVRPDSPEWTGRYAGRRAGTITCQGYVNIKLLDVKYPAHRLAWAHYYGSWPEHQIDHQNGDRADNRVVNLRDVPAAENHKNYRLSTKNTSGAIGVRWRSDIAKWESRVQHQRKVYNLGVFATFAEAAAVRSEASRRFGFHPNHGRAA